MLIPLFDAEMVFEMKSAIYMGLKRSELLYNKNWIVR